MVLRKIAPRTAYAIEIGVLALVALLCAVFGMWVGDRTPPVSVIKMGAITHEIEPGGDAVYFTDFYRHKSCATRADRFWVDSHGTRFTADSLSFASGALPLGVDHAIIHAHVPERIAGPVKLITNVSYFCNPLQRAFWPIPAETRAIDFEVVSK